MEDILDFLELEEPYRAKSDKIRKLTNTISKLRMNRKELYSERDELQRKRRKN